MNTGLSDTSMQPTRQRHVRRRMPHNCHRTASQPSPRLSCQRKYTPTQAPGLLLIAYSVHLHGDPAPPAQKGGESPPPQFSAYVCCGNTAGCIKIPLGMEVGLCRRLCVRWDSDPFPLLPIATKLGLGPGDCVRWGRSSAPPKRGTACSFRFVSIVAKRLDG